MSRINQYFREHNPGHLTYHCEGCDMPHTVYVGPANGNPTWGFNGNHDKPTFTPSVLVTYKHWTPPASSENPDPGPQTQVIDICHTFITDGMVQFLGDCTHQYAGQTRPMAIYDGEYAE